ncbi:MAG: mechanosensitive ion channel family protein [Flavobacteriaceae bacterium]|nr:mechanosensitive ion channel family protein [Flavobacteriaceae bacterium]
MKNILLPFLMLFTLTSFVQENLKVDVSNPKATITTHLKFLNEDNYHPEKSARAFAGIPTNQAKQYAIKLKMILKGKGLKVDYDKIPTDPNFVDTTAVNKPNKYVLFPKQLPQVYLVKSGNSWYFSDETVSEIENLYDEVYPWHSQWIHTLIPQEGKNKFLNIELRQLFSIVIIAVSFLILYFIFRIILTFILRKIQLMIFHRTDQNIKIALKQFARPIVILILINLIGKIIPSLLFHVDVNYFLILAINIVSTIFWVYVFLNLVKVLMIFYEDYTSSTPSKLDDQLVPVLRNFLKGIVIFIGFLKLLTDFGLDPTTVIAGASIGGIAIAFASQDTVKNLIGTFMIFLDKPFHIGDWIEAAEVEGTVEEVGFRSTKIRAFDTSIFQIPNSKLAEIVVNNKGLRLFRRYKTELGIRYDTPPELIEAFVKGVRQLVILHPDTHSEQYNVEFTGFGTSSLLILLNVYFKQLDWNVEQSSRHRLHIAILKLAHELGVEFAFPATTVYIEQFPEKTGRNLKYDLSDDRIKKVIQKIMEDFKKEID